MNSSVDLDALKTIIRDAKRIAMQYRSLTGKPLGITGEVGEFVAAELLNLQLTDARNPGYDAIGPDNRRIQIKSRCILPTSKPNQRVGGIRLDHVFDTVMLVLMNEEFEPLLIYEAKRDDVARELQKPGSISRNKRGAIGIQKFVEISAKVWSWDDSKTKSPNSTASFLAQLTDSLVAFANTLSAEDLLPTVVPEAASLVATDPYAFAIATCLDRGMKAEIIWTIPYDIHNYLGHLDPFKINLMSEEELLVLFKNLPHHPRYLTDAPRTIKELTRIVVDKCGGDTSRIWVGKQASEVKRTFQSIHGVGPGIASMGLLLIEKAFLVRFDDRENMDIKPDVHTVRVLYRLGVSKEMTTESALDASRKMNPEFPGKVDGALWEIGRRWCRPTNPDCLNCPVTAICLKRT